MRLFVSSNLYHNGFSARISHHADHCSRYHYQNTNPQNINKWKFQYFQSKQVTQFATFLYSNFKLSCF